MEFQNHPDGEGGVWRLRNRRFEQLLVVVLPRGPEVWRIRYIWRQEGRRPLADCIIRHFESIVSRDGLSGEFPFTVGTR